MEEIHQQFIQPVLESPVAQSFVKRFKSLYKEGSIWTLETGCLIFTSWMVYYLIFISPETTGVLDIIVLVFFLLGAATYVVSSSIFKHLSRSFDYSTWTRYVQTANRYLFMILSFLPGLYFAFKYEQMILRYYVVIHFTTSLYFLYKRYKEFEFEPFAIGVAMSVALYMVGPIIRTFFSIFGRHWFWMSCAEMVEGVVDLALAVAFLLRLPQKYLPSNMLFGLKLIKYFMYFLSWQTWFILMVVATWCNLGAGAQSIVETWNGIEINGAVEGKMEGDCQSKKKNKER